MAEEDITLYDERLVGYLAVPLTEAAEILKTGYVGSVEWDKRVPPPGHDKCHTARVLIPFGKDRTSCVKAMRKYRTSTQFTMLLEIRRVADDGTQWPYTFEQMNGHDQIKLGDDHVLHPKYLKNGVVIKRGAAEHKDAPCPICTKSLGGTDPAWLGGMDVTDVRGKVGMAVYVGDAFMVVPCPDPACIKAQGDRQDRLDSMPTFKLYHACSRVTANLIKKSGGKFIRGQGGAAGGGIYFSHTPREAWWKAEDMKWLSDDQQAAGTAPMKWLRTRGQANFQENGYCFFECEVKMGNIFQGKRWQTGLTFSDMITKNFDSCILDRGQTGYPGGKVPDPPVIAPAIEKTEAGVAAGTMLATRQEDIDAGKAQKLHGGYEFIVYSWDQVRIIRELPFKEIDPPPPLSVA